MCERCNHPKGTHKDEGAYPCNGPSIKHIHCYCPQYVAPPKPSKVTA